MITSIPREAERRSARVEVLLEKLRAELVAASVLRIDRERPTIRIGPEEAALKGTRPVLVRWTIYLATPDE